MNAIEIEGVWKKFIWHQTRARTFKETLLSLTKGGAPKQEPFWALRDVGFTVRRGETFGVVGSNGSGKSTLLKLITGISKPNKGKVTVNGKISALLELGAGFHPDFTGRENIYLNASILGISRREISEQFDEIVEFAEIAPFIDQPVKTYSSGMYMRLAFSIAVKVNPDILVVDEVLAVGDSAFQDKCFKQIERFKNEGKTILIVSHDLGSLKRFCDRVAWISKGKFMEVGPAGEVIDRYYQDLIGVRPAHAAAPDDSPVSAPKHHPILISDFRFAQQDAADEATFTIGEPLEVSFTYRCIEKLDSPRLLVKVHDATGQELAVSHAQSLQASEGALRFSFAALNLAPGSYRFELGYEEQDVYAPLQQASFFVLAHRLESGVRLDGSWSTTEALIG
ncbi:ATP-binding cassette domain-containing protein [bacterium]|nr:ATP-binding cassette domain-containing protein [bacterium]